MFWLPLNYRFSERLFSTRGFSEDGDCVCGQAVEKCRHSLGQWQRKQILMDDSGLRIRLEEDVLKLDSIRKTLDC